MLDGENLARPLINKQVYGDIRVGDTCRCVLRAVCKGEREHKEDGAFPESAAVLERAN